MFSQSGINFEYESLEEVVNQDRTTGLAMDPMPFQDDMKLGRHYSLSCYGVPNCVSITDSVRYT